MMKPGEFVYHWMNCPGCNTRVRVYRTTDHGSARIAPHSGCKWSNKYPYPRSSGSVRVARFLGLDPKRLNLDRVGTLRTLKGGLG